MSENTNSPEATQPKIAYSTLKEIHRRNREEVQDRFFNRKRFAPENRGIMSDMAKDQTRKELEGGVDSLTGLLNKKGFQKRLDEALAIAKRDKQTLYGVVLDADGLKAINDMMGHKEGDKYIAKIGALFTKSMRAGDFVGRTGGDEFIAILHATTDDEVAMWWKRQDALFKEDDVRISGGAYKLDYDDAQGSLDVADEAMYAAKLNKRNEKNNFMIATQAKNPFTFEDYTTK